MSSYQTENKKDERVLERRSRKRREEGDFTSSLQTDGRRRKRRRRRRENAITGPGDLSALGGTQTVRVFGPFRRDGTVLSKCYKCHRLTRQQRCCWSCSPSYYVAHTKENRSTTGKNTLLDYTIAAAPVLRVYDLNIYSHSPSGFTQVRRRCR